MQTPYYIIHKEQLDKEYRKLADALQNNWDNYIIGYSYKTNALPWVITYMNHLGAYAEVVSEDEYCLAKKVGVKHEHIIYNGPIKTKDSFQEALIHGAIVNIDSQRELEWIKELPFSEEYNVGLRVNFDIEHHCPGQSQCPEDGGRFGFCYENGELGKVIECLEKRNIHIKGLHLHTSSKTRGKDIYAAICHMACTIKKEYQLDLDYVDVGGGFFGGLPTKPQFKEYMKLMSDILKEQFQPEKTKLIVEPGMALIGVAISYVTTVIDVKDTTYNRFVVTDGTRTSIDPLMTKSSYFYKVEKNKETDIVDKQIVCGYTCMEHDHLFACLNQPELQVGDRVIYDKVGAYTMCLTPLFIRYFPGVYVEDGNELYCVREKWTPDEYIQKSKVWKA